MLHIYKLLIISLFSMFILACSTLEQEPLNSSPDSDLTSSGTIPGQVATGEVVTYTLPVLADTIYKISVYRTYGSDPIVSICDSPDCASGSLGVVFPDELNTFDGTLTWYLSNSANTLYIHIGGGDESKYAISAKNLTSETPASTALTLEQTIYGTVYGNQQTPYTLAVTTGNSYHFVLTPDDEITPDTIDLKICAEAECTTVLIDTTKETTLSANIDQTWYVFVNGNLSNAIYHLKVTEAVTL